MTTGEEQTQARYWSAYIGTGATETPGLQGPSRGIYRATLDRQTGELAITGRTLREIRALSEGDMPPLLYVLAHPRARLSDADRAAPVAWARTLR